MDFLELVKEYGIITALAIFLHLPTYSYIWKHRKNIEAVPKLEENLANVHMGCKISPTAITDLENDVHELKNVDTKMEERLESMNKSLDKMDIKLDKLIDLHLKD